jgi:hypothetical protein
LKGQAFGATIFVATKPIFEFGDSVGLEVYHRAVACLNIEAGRLRFALIA